MNRKHTTRLIKPFLAMTIVQRGVSIRQIRRAIQNARATASIISQPVDAFKLVDARPPSTYSYLRI